MAGIQTGIELNDDFSQQIYSMVNAVNAAVSGMEQLQQTMNANVSTAGIDSVHDGVNRAAIAVNELIGLLDQLNNTDPSVDTSAVMPSTSAPLEQAQPRAPPDWWHDGLEVFTNTGIERFEQEVQSTDAMITGLTTNLQRTAQVAAGMNMLPPGAAQDIQSVQARLQVVQQRIQQIEANPMNIGVDAANDGLEELRSQLYQAQQAQEALDDALENMDVRGANEAYIQLSQTVSHIEQYIRDNVDEQGRFNSSIEEGTNAADGLTRSIAAAVGAYVSIQSIKNVIGVSDEFMSITARLNQMNDGLQSTDELIELVYLAAQDARGSFTDMADVVARFGNNAKDAFSSSAEVVAFADLVQKQMTIAGAGTQEASNAMLQLSQALGSGVLRGDELNSIFEQAPNLIQGIADYLEVPIGEIRAMAAEGQLSADIVKAAIFAGADEINAKFEEMPMTWGQIWQSMQNTALMNFQPVLKRLNDIGNSDAFMRLVNGATQAFSILAGVVVEVFDIITQGAQLIADNWSWLEPIILGVAGALMVYYGAQLAANTISAISTGIHMAMAAAQMAHAAMTGTLTAATAAQIAAQEGLNAAMYASPIVWIVMLVIALVAVLYAAAAAVAHFTGIANSGLGVIAGAIGVVIGFFQQLWSAAVTIFQALGAAASALAHNMVAAFHNSIANIQSFFYNLLSTAMSVISQIASALSALPFVEFDAAGLAGAAGDYAAKAQAAQDSKMEYRDIGAAFQEQMAGFSAFESGWAADSFAKGAAVGDGIAASIGDALSFDFGGTDSLSDMSALDAAMASGVGSGLDASGIPGAAGGTADNTGKMAQEMSKTSEDLKYLRDIAEQETVNRYTLAEVNVDMSGMNNNINNGMDLDGVVSGLTDAVNESIDNITEGVHE